ncbi:uncharacterized protein TRIADDRAFT_53491 [Trichoplax adhaerens]|uniref:GyrI-like small molecule binding domain-containing protein n=1 Tax=Trichoplax adhaerens TaxID=10228 RepID=B3RPD1_TRIAD|nr:hypothetical protein TRIADDRAFT_53491 [Trichoplax adhaerens]EDV28169.1 hypothetical protein TRIADDRAFT_53491 [Trichoplax adhaerens]|eukprot:XP_002110003.1 hypothetical protein TRIADDRAFT_53491 [Trichoplax adhaerens]
MVECGCLAYLAVTLLVAGFLYLTYNGLLYPIVLRTAKPPYICNQLSVFYKVHVGAYRNVGTIFDEARKLLPSSDGSTLGIYYDDPNTVKEENCRSVVAAVVGENGSPIDASVKQRYLQAGFKQYELPAVTQAVFCYFPFKGIVSILISVIRVYPKLGKYIQENKLTAFPMMEVYDKQTVAFIAPLEHQKFFYPPGIEVPKE